MQYPAARRRTADELDQEAAGGPLVGFGRAEP
jgi:hypothetical protein